MTGNKLIIAGMAGRYATALFELARDKNQLDQVDADLKALQGMLVEASDLERLFSSPVFSAEDQAKAIQAVAQKAGFGDIANNFLQVVARNRRLSSIVSIMQGFKSLLADHRGEITAEATSASPLSESQQQSLRETLKEIAGQDIELISKVDPSILGGLIVKVGSRQIDDSLRTKLNIINKRMKEVS